MIRDIRLLQTRQNSALPPYVWTEIDKQIKPAVTATNAVINIFRDANAVTKIDSIGETMYCWAQSQDSGEAAISMDATVQKFDVVDNTIQTVELPLFHKDFFLSGRTLIAAEEAKSNIVFTNQNEAIKKIDEKIEQTILFGYNSPNGFSGLWNHPKGFGGQVWTGIADIEISIIQAIKTLQANNYFGPYVFICNPNLYSSLNLPLNDGSGDNIFQRLIRITGISAIIPSKFLNNSQSILFQLTTNANHIALSDVEIFEWEYLPSGVTFKICVSGCLCTSINNGTAGIVSFSVM